MQAHAQTYFKKLKKLLKENTQSPRDQGQSVFISEIQEASQNLYFCQMQEFLHIASHPES